MAQSVFNGHGSPRVIGMSHQQADSRLTGVQDTLKSYEKNSVFSANSAVDHQNYNQGSMEGLNKNNDSHLKPNFNNQSMAMPSAVTNETSKFNIVVSPTKLVTKPSQEQIMEEGSLPSLNSQEELTNQYYNSNKVANDAVRKASFASDSIMSIKD